MITAKRNGDSIRNSSRGGTPPGSKNDPRWACEYQLSSPMHPHSNCWAEMSTLAASELAQTKRFPGWRTTSRLRKGDIPRLFGTLFARCFLRHDNTVMLAGGGAMASKEVDFSERDLGGFKYLDRLLPMLARLHD